MPPSTPIPQPNPAPGKAALPLPWEILEANTPSEPPSVPLLTAGSDPENETMSEFQPLETFSCSEPFSAPCNAKQNPVCNLKDVDACSAFEVTREGGSNTADTLPGSVQVEANELHEPDDSYTDVPTSELRKNVLELQDRLQSEGVLVLTPIIWNGETCSEEKLAMRRAYFLFAMYRADAHTEIRTVVGFAVCFLSLLVIMQMRPFAGPKLNQLIITGLAFQTTTLTYGILVGVQGNALKDTSVSRYMSVQMLQTTHCRCAIDSLARAQHSGMHYFFLFSREHCYKLCSALTFVSLIYVESRVVTRFEMQVLQWVVVILNCLLIIFPYIWTFLMWGSQVRSHRQHLYAQGKISNDYLPPMLLWLFLGITCLLKCIRIKVIAMQGASRP